MIYYLKKIASFMITTLSNSVENKKIKDKYQDSIIDPKNPTYLFSDIWEKSNKKFFSYNKMEDTYNEIKNEIYEIRNPFTVDSKHDTKEPNLEIKNEIENDKPFLVTRSSNLYEYHQEHNIYLVYYKKVKIFL